MPTNIKILVLESKETDVISIRRCLQNQKNNFEIRSVDNKESYLNELEANWPDVILANHCVKDIDAFQALELKDTKNWKIPFILVTDNTGELFAVKIMKNGAYDYLLKSDLSTLSSTIELALEYAQTWSTNQKQQENEIFQRSLLRNTAFLNAIPDMIFVTDRSGVIKDFHASKAMEPFVNPEYFLGKNCTEVLPVSIASEILKNIVTVLNGIAVPLHEYQLVYPDGMHDFECRYAAINENEVLSIVRDITQHKQAEKELIKSKKQFQNLVESISGVYWVNNLDTREAVYISPSYEIIWGRKCEDYYNNVADFINGIYPDDRESFLKAYQNIDTTLKTNITYRIVRPDGNIRWISEKANVMIDSDGTKYEYGYAEDITERMMVESELAESENRLKAILQNEPECVKLVDEDGCLIDMNPAGLEMIEADNLEMVKGNELLSIIDEPYKVTFTDLVKDVFNGKAGRMEFTITGLKGTQRWMETHAVPFRNADGKIISLLAVTRDISQRKMAQENEKQLTQKLLKGAEIANFGFIDWNLITNEMNLSQQANEIFGINEDRLISVKFMREIVYAEDVKLINKNLEMVKKGMKEYNLDHRIVWPSGTIRWVNTRAELYRDETGKAVRLFGTVLDITEQKNAELQIRTYNEQLRLLTAHLQGIREEERTRIGREIHDELGQQLTAIKMDVAWIDKNTSDKKEAITSKIKNIIGLLDGSNQSVRKILSELRPATLDNYGLPEAMEWHIKQFTDSAHIPVKLTISEPDLKLQEDIATNIFRIFQESLTNIMRYARAKEVIISLNVIDNTIKMNIEDNGVGFDMDTLLNKKTFGILGMRERVRSLDGQFEIDSAPGKGTKISISLPYNK